MNEQEFEIKRDKIVKLAKWGGLGLIVVLLAPVIFLATAAYAGAAVAAVVAGVASLVSTYYLPVLSMRLANWSLKARKEEARKNPIETLENQLRVMASDLDKRKADLALFISRGKALMDDVKAMEKEDPEGAAEYDDEIAEFLRSSELRGKNLQKAVKDYEEAKTKVAKVRRRWEMRQRNADFLKGSKEEDKALSDIMAAEAIDAVMEKAHQATSEAMVENLVESAKTEAREERANRGKYDRATPTPEGWPAPGLTPSQLPHDVPTTPVLQVNDQGVHTPVKMHFGPRTKKD